MKMRVITRTPMLMAIGMACATGVLAPPVHADGPGDEAIEWQRSETGEGYYRPPDETAEEPGRGSPPRPDADGYYYLTLAGTEPYDRPDGHRFVCADDPRQLEDCDASHYGCWTLWDDNGPYADPSVGRNAFPHVQFRQHEDWTDDGAYDPLGRFQYMDWSCVVTPDDDWVGDDEIWEVNLEAFQELGRPDLAFAPDTTTLIHLPTIAYTDYPTATDLAGGDAVLVSGEEPGEEVVIRIPVVVDKPSPVFEGEVTATAEFEWTFDGADPQDGRGRPYERGVLPRTNPDYYVDHTFTTTGTKTVELQLTWTGTVAVPGLGIDEPILPVEMEIAAETIDVVENRAVLTDN